YTSLPCFCGCRIGGACSRLAISTCRDRQRQGRSDHALDRLRLPPTHLEIPPLNWVPINGCITSAERLSLIVCTPVRRESFGRCASISSERFCGFSSQASAADEFNRITTVAKNREKKNRIIRFSVVGPRANLPPNSCPQS